MRKTIDLLKKDIEAVEEYQKRNGLKNFSEAVRSIIRAKKCNCAEKKKESELSDDNFALLGDLLLKMDRKIDLLTVHLTPKTASEVKK